MIKLSASSIICKKSCPIKYRNKYHYHIVPVEDADALRIGTNWHRLLEIISLKPGSVCPECAKKSLSDPKCVLCAGTGFIPEDIIDAIYRELDAAYSKIPFGIDMEKLGIERTILLNAILAYKWYYEDVQENVLVREQKFELPLRKPKTGRALPNVCVVGKIDKIILIDGIPYIKEHKSTGDSIDNDSRYWNHLELDTQTTLYLYAAREYQKNGWLAPFGLKADAPLIAGVLYDVWHKPQIRPKKLTQAESKKFVADGEYFGQKFEVRQYPEGDIQVNNEPTEIELGAKEGTFAIRETPEMFGARLLDDLTTRPEYYFNCKPVPIRENKLKNFESQLINIYRDIQAMTKSDGWWPNEYHCEAKYPCEYIDVCYNGIEISPDSVPDGFKLLERKG